MGLSKATASRMLSVLEQEGLVVRPSGSAEHQLGPEMVALGMLALRTVDFRLVARQELRVLADTTGGDSTLESWVGSGS